MIKVTTKGDFSKAYGFIERVKEVIHRGVFDKYGQMGVEALYNATPKRTGKTAASWYYKITRSKGKVSIEWCNSNVQNGTNIAVILQYGHSTRQGTYVRGRDYINPAMRSVFDQIAADMWKEVAGK